MEQFIIEDGGGATGPCADVSNITVNGTTYVPQWCQEFDGSAGPPDTTVFTFDLGTITAGVTVKSRCTADRQVTRTTRRSARRASAPLRRRFTSMAAATLSFSPETSMGRGYLAA